jgi:hypothetical protein
MASGHVSHRPNTCSTDQACDVKISLANPEPSTHGTKPTWCDVRAWGISGSPTYGLLGQLLTDAVEKVENRKTLKVSRKSFFRHCCSGKCFRMNRFGSSGHRARSASAVFKIFVLHPKKIFSTASVINGLRPAQPRLPLSPQACAAVTPPKAESRPPSICRRDRCEIETSGLLPAAVAVA